MFLYVIIIKSFIGELIMKKKYLCIILTLLSIFSMIISLNLFTKEQIVLKINSDNREHFRDFIQNDKVDNIDSITKVKLGQGWHSSELFIHYSFGKVEKINLTEGNFNYLNLEQYVRENGYDLDNSARILFLISILSFILVIILIIISKKSTSQN